tara:strand:- start:36979 stop:37116 length:138 start_codon:yes stop_codon:yes gene_type:complete
MKKEEVNPDNDSLDTSEEYFRNLYSSAEIEEDIYFPIDESTPPHY